MTSAEQIGAGALESYLSRQFERPAVLLRATRSFPGLSRETWFVVCQVQGRPVDLVLRFDPPGGPGVPFPLEREWRVYQALWGTSIPVPEPLWFDPASDVAGGRPLMARAMVDGSLHPSGADREDQFGRNALRRYAFTHLEQLAALHLLDWEPTGLGQVLGAPDCPAEAFRTEVRQWRSAWEENARFPSALVEEAGHWLEESAPVDGGKVSLVKGNNGIGEEVWRDDRIVALVDWELACLSDPALDLAFSQGLTDVLSPEEILHHYESCSGLAMSSRRLAFATLLVAYKTVCCLSGVSLSSYLIGSECSSMRVTLGLGPGRNMARCLGGVIGMDIEEAAAKIAAALPGNGYLAAARHS